jgi:hypothetical protein
MYQKWFFERNLSLLGECLSILYVSKKVVRKELITSGGVFKHPICIKKGCSEELITSGGVLKHPICIKKGCSEGTYHFRGSAEASYMYQKRLFRRNLSLLGECRSILYVSKKVVRKELITSGGVLKHPICIKKGCSEGTYHFWGSA